MSQQTKSRLGEIVRILYVIFCFPVLLTGASATVTWNPNTESDLAGYQVHYGTSPGVYSTIVDVENVTEYKAQNLVIGQTYYFAVTAYDNSGNVSDYSEEVSYTAQDGVPPTVSKAYLLDVDRLKVIYSESVDEVTAEQVSNYSINNSIAIQQVELQPDQISVIIYTIQHANGNYTLTINNVTDCAPIPNAIAPNTTATYSWDQNDETKPTVTSVALVGTDHVQVNFSEPVEQNSAKTLSNYQISGGISISSASLTDDFMSVILTTSQHTPGSSYTISISNVKDAASNVMNSVSKSYTAPSANAEAPRLIAVQAVNQNVVEVQFSETVSQTTAQNAGNYSIQPGITVISASLNADKTTVTLSTTAHSSGDYTITVSGVQDQGQPPLTMNGAQLSYNYTPPDNVKPQVVDVEISNGTLLLVKFNELIDQSSAANVNNYQISPAVSVLNAAMDNTGMNVYLITEEHPAGDFNLSISGVKDLAQNVMNNTSRTYTYVPPDRTPPVLTGAVIEGASFLELAFNEELDRNSAQTIGNYTVSPSVSVTQADLVNGNHVYLKTGTHQSGQNYTITVNGVRDKAMNVIQSGSNTASYQAPIVDNISPLLSSVEVLGAKSIQLTFSEAMEEASACQTGNYSINGITVQGASMDLSKRTVYLKTSEHQPGVQYKVNVANVKDLAGNTVPSTQSKIYTLPAQDTQPPRVKEVDLLGDDVVVIYFDESVDATSAAQKGNYDINGGISILSINITGGNTEVWLETSVHQRGTYQLTVRNIKDQTDNAMTANTYEYQYSPPDNDPPVLLDVEVISPYTLELQFNEALDPVTAENVSIYKVENSVNQEVLSVTKAILDRTNTKVTLITSEHIPGSYTVTVDGVKDGNSGNVSGSLSLAYPYTPADKTPPVIELASLETSTLLAIQFSEALEAVSATKKANYTINNDITVKSVFLSSEGDVMLETTEHAAGEYTLTVNGVRDASNNTIQPYSQVAYTWNPNDTIPPQLAAASLVDNNFLKLVFNEPVNATDAENIANYSINNNEIAIKNATLSAQDPKEVFLLTDVHEPGTYQIKVNNIRDRAFVPNVIKTNNQKTYLCSNPDTEPPEIITVEAKSPYAVYLTFNETVSMEEAQNITNYTITPNIQVNGATLMANRQTVILETSIHDAGITYTVEVRNMKDRAPIPNVMTSSQSKNYYYTKIDDVPPKLMSAKLLESDLLELIFSEPLEKTSAEKRNNYQIVPGVEIANAVLDLETQKKVMLETSMHLPGFTYTVSVRDVRDLSPVPNTIDPYTSKSYSNLITADNSTELQVVRIEPLNATQIDVVFNRPLDKASAENKSNYIINEGEIDIQAAVIDSNLARVHLTTASHDLGQAYHLQIRNIKDRSATPKLLSGTSGIPYIMSTGMSMSSLSRSGYQFASFEINAPSFTDRDYTVTQAPEYLDGSLRIVTANNDKMMTDDSFLTFELKGGAKCVLAYDARIDSVPVWLSEWELTGDKIVDSRSNVFDLYEKYLSEGKVALGANCGGPEDNMYQVYFVPQGTSGLQITSLSKSNYQLSHLEVGDKMYIDRDYTLASVPDILDGLMWLKTANDDKANQESVNFLSFTVSDSSQIYVIFDSRIASVPQWLDNWEACDGQVVDSRGTPFDVYTKMYSGGKVELGGNGGDPESNMYLVAFRSLASTENKWSKMPGFFTLDQNYPNPFNPITNIRYTVHKPGLVTLSIYNVLGQRVKVLVNRNLNPGEYSEQWDANDHRGIAVSSGVYFYRIETHDFAKTKRMLLIR
ncbi:Ig-like domain-containing protein [bacterium]|nr:Ig-like domain-containing protein [bacterium]